MVLTKIYLSRHGFRSNWVVDPQTGVYSGTVKSPTNIPSDPALAGYGEKQAEELGRHLVTLNPAVDVIYSSPFYRCLQTLAPAVKELATRDGGKLLEVRGENGLGEWYGTARFDHPSPATPELLRTLFSFYAADYKPLVIPSSAGESIDELHDRTAYTLARIIEALDNDPRQPSTLLICTHAATLIAAGRVLTGFMPEDPAEQDFKPYTCSISSFARRLGTSAPTTTSIPPPSQDRGQPRAEGAHPLAEEKENKSDINWREGKGVGGGWDCVLNGDCSFLSGGEERGWNFGEA